MISNYSQLHFELNICPTHTENAFQTKTKGETKEDKIALHPQKNESPSKKRTRTGSYNIGNDMSYILAPSRVSSSIYLERIMLTNSYTR